MPARRYLLQYMHAAHEMAAHPQRGKADLAVVSPHVATAVTKALVDGYWSVYYATGDPHVITRVVDVATLYAPFMDEYGGAPAMGDALPPLPSELEEDAFSAMRFDCGRYAIWTLLTNAATHASVGDVYLRHATELGERLAQMDPVALREDVTAFARSRVDVMAALVPAVQELREGASAGGIGSGQWPASYRASVEVARDASFAVYASSPQSSQMAAPPVPVPTADGTVGQGDLPDAGFLDGAQPRGHGDGEGADTLRQLLRRDAASRRRSGGGGGGVGTRK